MTPPNPPEPSWWSRNWDKVLGFVISLVVGGVAGFFTAIMTIQGDLHEVDSRVTVVETEATTTWRPKALEVDVLRKEVEALKRSAEESQRKSEADALLRDRLRQMQEETRRRTASELQEILKESR